MRVIFIHLSLLFFCANRVCSQTAEWWKSLVNWDNVSPYYSYIIYSPEKMGPNALPVPRLQNGSIDSINSIAVSGSYHFMKGDKTVNTTLYGNYCLVKNRISISAFIVPVEFFKMSHQLKEERRVYYKNYNHQTATGDLHLAVNIQLLNKIRKEIALALRLGYRYASSGGIGLSLARMTDAPGYFFDFSASRSFSKSSHWKWMTMAGFFVWQLNGVEYNQNDAFLFGAGVEYEKNKFKLQSSLCGYLGYIGNGDAPIVYRINAEKSGKKWGTLLQFQYGLQDFTYTSLEAGIKYIFQN